MREFKYSSERKFFIIQKIDSAINHLVKAEKQVKKVMSVQPELVEMLKETNEKINEECAKLLKLRFKVLNNGEEL